MTLMDLIREMDRLWLKAERTGLQADRDAYEVLKNTVDRLMSGGKA